MRRSIAKRILLSVGITITLLFFSPQPNASQAVSNQNPSPMVDYTRPHPRLERIDVPGQRFDLTSLKGARLFIGSHVNANKSVPLLIHFHGAPWLVEMHVGRYLPRAALISVQLGAGSNAYRRPFEEVELFQKLLDEAGLRLGAKRGWSSITLTGFSAGYGAIREILKSPNHFSLINNVLLLDGMHASYQPEKKPLAEGGVIDEAGVAVFVSFAREAMLGKKNFAFTHSEIFPGTYASTTECADYLLKELGLSRRSQLRKGPLGMQQLSSVSIKGLHVRGYAGNTAPDHIDHLHAMPAWFRYLKFRR